MKLWLTLLAALCLTSAIAQKKSGSDPRIRNVPWATKPKLAWSDFKVVDICSDTMPDGHMEWGMVKTYTSNGHDDVSYKMRAIVVLKLDDCWVCKNVPHNDTLLWYLQATYDLAELYNRKLNELYQKTSLKNMSDEQIGRFMMESQTKIELVYSDGLSWFYAETAHGLDKEGIVRWKDMIEKELKQMKE